MQWLNLYCLCIFPLSAAAVKYYAMYDVYASGDLSCALNFQKIYLTDLQEAQALNGNSALTTSNCTGTNGYYVTRTCNFTNGYEIVSSYTSADCLGTPLSVSTLAPNACFGNNPPLRYRGCTPNRTSTAKSGRFLNSIDYTAPSPEVRLFVFLLVFWNL